MALASRYTFSFYSLIDSEQFSVVIKQEGYTGYPDALEFLPGRNPITLSYDKTNASLLHPIRGGQLTINLSLEASDLEEFVLADNRTWFIEVTGTNGFEWYGWMQPQSSIIYSPYGIGTIGLQFSDGLGALQTTPDNVLSTAFVEKQSLTEMIERLVSYTDIDLPVTINTTVKHDGEIGTANDTVFLEQALSLDYNGQQPQNAYDLLSRILRLIHCTIYQKNGTWVVENLIDKSLLPYPDDLTINFQVLDKSLIVRFESPLSKVTAESRHYEIRHTQNNRDFAIANFDMSDNFLNFPDWVQQGTNATAMVNAVTLGGKQYARIFGNYVASNGNSTDYLENSGGSVEEGQTVRIFVAFENVLSTPSDITPQFAIELNESGNTWWFSASSMTFIDQPTPILNTSDILSNIGQQVIIPASGTIKFRIYRPIIPSLGTTYNSGVNYCRWAYAEALAGKQNVDNEYKLFRCVGTKDNRGLRENEKFDTIGLAFDREVAPPTETAIDYDAYVSLFYDEDGAQLTGDFVSDYMATSQPWGLTEFAVNTYMRLFAKPQLYVEAALYGKGLSVGDIYEIDVPGFASAYLFVVVAFDYDIRNDTYNVLFSYISYDSVDTITMQNYWLQQNQNDSE